MQCGVCQSDPGPHPSVATKLRARRRHAECAQRGTRWRVWATRRPTGDAV